MYKLFMILAVSILLIGCGMDASAIDKREVESLQHISSTYEIVKDEETGCEYIRYYYSTGGSLSAMYDEFGKVKGCKYNK